jgi:hypothetical protein
VRLIGLRYCAPLGGRLGGRARLGFAARAELSACERLAAARSLLRWRALSSPEAASRAAASRAGRFARVAGAAAFSEAPSRSALAGARSPVAARGLRARSCRGAWPTSASQYGQIFQRGSSGLLHVVHGSFKRRRQLGQRRKPFSTSKSQ